MYSERRLSLLFALLFLFVAIAKSVEDSNSAHPITVEFGNGAKPSIMQLLEAAFSKTGKACLMEAANFCVQYLIRPMDLLSCGQTYINANQKNCNALFSTQTGSGDKS